MASLDFEIKNKILSFLRTSESGASASEISKKINHNRITVGKYLQILEAQSLVTFKKIASGIYWSISETHVKPKVLIVDDEKHIVDLIRLCLSSSGYILYEAYDGEEATQMSYSLQPDLIILDIMMPKKDGTEVCRELKSNILTQDIIVLILSAKGEVKDKVALMSDGADDYLVKPFDPLELEARVSNLLRKKQSQSVKHSITQLPNGMVTNETRTVWGAQKKRWFELQISIDNYDGFAKQHGYKKAAELLRLFVRMLIGICPPDTFIGHNTDTTIVLFSVKSLRFLEKSILERFSQLLPFFYPDGILAKFKKSDSTLNLTISEVLHA
jgi:CheY-like chemotaxis protein